MSHLPQPEDWRVTTERVYRQRQQQSEPAQGQSTATITETSVRDGLQRSPTDMVAKAQRKAEKEARKQAERETREAERQRQENERQLAEFWASPVGQARAAHEAGDTLFQFSLPVRDTRRTALAAMTHNMQTTTKERSGHGQLLSAIEKEGWTLVHAGVVFEQHGQASRDKMFASGQQVAIDGQTVGIYVFRAV